MTYGPVLIDLITRPRKSTPLEFAETPVNFGYPRILQFQFFLYNFDRSIASAVDRCDAVLFDCF